MYDYNEIVVLMESEVYLSQQIFANSHIFLGEIRLKDSPGQTEVISCGDTFFFPRGITITFLSENYGVAWKCGEVI